MRDEIQQLLQQLLHAGFSVRETAFASPLNDVPTHAAGIPLPEFLREIYQQHTAQLEVRYEKTLSQQERELFGAAYPHEILTGGPLLLAVDALEPAVEISQAWLADSETADDPEEREFRETTVPFAAIGQGDYLGFDAWGQVNYLSHDAESFTLEADFGEFWLKWQRLNFVGPEWWLLEPFWGEHGLLVGNLENVARFRDSFARLLLQSP